jgi:hypothetical protein
MDISPWVWVWLVVAVGLVVVEGQEEEEVEGHIGEYTLRGYPVQLEAELEEGLTTWMTWMYCRDKSAIWKRRKRGGHVTGWQPAATKVAMEKVVKCSWRRRRN